MTELRNWGLLSLLFSLAIGGPTLLASPSLGVNLLQSEQVAFTDPRTLESMTNLREMGADHVALVVFIEQDSPEDTNPRIGRQVTDIQLVAAIRAAHGQGLETIVKPQILVRGSWAGEVYPASVERWFASYRQHIVHYAKIAEREQAMALVIGTEMMQLGKSEHWDELINDVRRVYSGKLTYAAHGAEGLRRFGYWHRLDAIGVSLYPSLGPELHESKIRDQVTAHLDELPRDLNAPLWILEFGQPSASGSLQDPWDWRALEHESAAADPNLQQVALQGWLSAIRDEEMAHSRIERATLWNWFNDPHAGGSDDNGYTPQNKPSERMVRCVWIGHCNEQRGVAN